MLSFKNILVYFSSKPIIMGWFESKIVGGWEKLLYMLASSVYQNLLQLSTYRHTHMEGVVLQLEAHIKKHRVLWKGLIGKKYMNATLPRQIYVRKWYFSAETMAQLSPTTIPSHGHIYDT